MKIGPVVLVLADISGYTQFVRLNKISVMHAETIVTDLLESVTCQARFPMKLNRLEGDAAFFYCEVADSNTSDAINDVAEQIKLIMSAFTITHDNLIRKSVGGCICDACCHIDGLCLKVFAHFGETVIKQANNHIELGGEPPIVIHRLSKNSIDSSEYVLVTDEFAAYMADDLYEDTKTSIESYEHIGDVGCKVFFPTTRTIIKPIAPRLSRLTGIAEAIRLFWIGVFYRTRRNSRRYRNVL